MDDGTAALDSFIKIMRHILTLACAPLGNKDHLDLILSRLIAPHWAHVAAATTTKEGERRERGSEGRLDEMDGRDVVIERKRGDAPAGKTLLGRDGGGIR